MCVQYFIFTGKMEVEGVSGWRSALFVSCKWDDFKNWYLQLSCQRKEKLAFRSWKLSVDFEMSGFSRIIIIQR